MGTQINQWEKPDIKSETQEPSPNYFINQVGDWVYGDTSEENFYYKFCLWLLEIGNEEFCESMLYFQSRFL